MAAWRARAMDCKLVFTFRLPAFHLAVILAYFNQTIRRLPAFHSAEMLPYFNQASWRNQLVELDISAI
ncbi:MAG: hypothetical protein ABSG60_00810 [Terracidiphilus sp.]